MKRRKFSFKKTALFFIVLIILVVLVFLGLYKFNTSAVSKNTDAVTVEVEKGDNYFTMASKLKKKNLRIYMHIYFHIINADLMLLLFRIWVC